MSPARKSPLADAPTLGRKYLEDEGSKYKDIARLRGAEQKLVNTVLSSRPCPDCSACDGMSMTYDEWASSEFGLPGSSGRICGGNCHCVLVPDDMVDELSNLGDDKLRGDEETDIRRIIDIGPAESDLKELMQQWYTKTGGKKLPPNIYSMPFDKVLPYMKKALAKLGGA